VQPLPELKTRARARRGRKILRRATGLVVVLLAALAGCGLFLASPKGKALVLRSVAASIRDRLGVEARAASLDYRLISRGVTLHDVNATQPGAPRPFFVAERIEVDLSLDILDGALALRRLDITRPEIVLDPSSRVESAVVPRRVASPEAIRSVEIERVDLRDLTLTSGGLADTQVTVRGLSLALVGTGSGELRGEVVVASGWSVRGSAGSIDFDRSRADVSLSGTLLSLTAIEMNSSGATVAATARIDVSRGDLDLKYDGRVDLGLLHQGWTDVSPLGGALEGSGTVGGTLDNPVGTFVAGGAGLRWREVTDAKVSASGRWSGAELVIDRYEVSSNALRAHAVGDAHVALDGNGGSSSLRAEGGAEDLRRLQVLTGAPALPGAPLTVVADLAWPGSVPSGATLGGRVRIAVPDVDSPRATIASLDADGRDGRWTVRQRGALEGGTNMAADISVAVDPETLSRSTIDGHVAARSADVAEALRHLRRRGWLGSNFEAVVRRGRATVDAKLTGTLAAPRLEASLTADSFALAGLEEVHAEALARFEGRAVEISRMTAEASGNRIDVHGTATVGGGPLHLALTAQLARPDVLAVSLPAAWRPSGSLELSGTLDGSSSEPRLAGRIAGSGLEANGIAVDALEGDVTFERGILKVTGLRLNRGAGWIRVDGDIDRNFGHMNWRGRGEKLTMSVHQLSDAALPSPAPAAPGALRLDDLSVEFDIAGTPEDPNGTLTATAGELEFRGHALGPVSLSAESVGRTVRFDFGLTKLSAKLTGLVGLEPGWPFEARADLNKSQLVSLLGAAAAPPDTSGTVTASTDIKGRLDRPFESTAVVEVAEIDGQLRGKPLRLVHPGRIRLDGPRPSVEEPIQMTLGGFSIDLARGTAERDSGAVIAVEGRLEDGIALLPSGVPVTSWLVEGPVRAQLSLDQEGNGIAISGDAEATLDRLMRADRELAHDVRLRAQIRGGAIEISEVAGTILSGPLTATARIPLAWAVPSWLVDVAAGPGVVAPVEATLSARTDATLAQALRALAIERENLSGSAKFALEAHASAPRLDDLVATLTMETGELSVANVSLSQQRPTRFRLDRGRLEVADLAWKGPRSVFTASGAIGLLPGTEGEFRAEGTSALSFLQTFAPGIAGEAAFQVHIAGPPEARRTAGKIDLNELSLIEPQQQWALAGLSGTVTLDADVLETQGLRGQLNGGDLTIGGAISIRPGVVASRPLKIEGRGLFVEIPRGLRSQLDASMVWENGATGSRLSGQISIAADTYREPITALAAMLAEIAPGRKRALPPWIADTALDVRLNSVGPLVVDQSVLRVELVPDVQLTGTVGSPALKGQVAIQEDGRVRAGGRSYRLTESRLDFSPDAGLIPRLNVIGETRVGSYLVTLRMTGPADEIETNFSSDPPLSERDVRSLLVTGQTADPARGTTDDRFAVGAVSGDMLGIAGQFVGLDSVQVGTEDLDLVSRDVNPATRLTVSKRLRTRFELVLSENLEESESTWIIIYRPVIGYEFRLSSEENTKEAIEFRQEITFGPGVSTRARARSATVAEDRIRAVTLTGDPGFPTGEVLSVTKVRAGDRFEFREWLSDRGRIERFYWDRGYYTARVVPMRSAAENTGKERLVDLQYRISRGSRTQLEVSGYTAGGDLIESLRQTWSENVVLDLLDDRLIKVARDHLIDDGFLRARIEVEVDRPEPEIERARVRIDPGLRTSSRRLAFSGNRVLASEALQELATSSQLDAEAWKDAAPLIDEIRAAYAAKGYLATRATAGAVEFASEVATLPIRIEEGPPARVASLNLTGVAPERQTAARDVVALPVGSPFTPGMDRTVRAKLERYYRDLGYRDARVKATATVAAKGSDVALALDVSEGPLHLIGSVEITGVQSTRPSLVNNAVQLRPGQPAGAEAAEATERRLYDLGTFRRAELRFEPNPAPVAAEMGTVSNKAIVAVEEPQRFQLRYGVELSSEYNSTLDQRTQAMGFAADLRDRNFLGRGMSLGGGLRYEPDLTSVRALFSVPPLSRHPIRTNVYATDRSEQESDELFSVDDHEVEFSVEQRWRASRAIEYSWGYSVNWRDSTLTPSTENETLAIAGTLASLNGAAVIDRRDSFFDAKRGWFSSVSLQWGRRELGSELDYLRTLIRGSYYQPLGPIVLAGNMRLGRLLPRGGDVPLTVFDLFFNAGGSESVRGYSQDSLSGYEFFGAPLGGSKLLVFNGELRTPLFWRFGGVLFADAGNTFAESQPITLHGLGVGIGVGLRINTALAPIRIDVGFPRSFGQSVARWHFSIGQMF
jgi:outer membrane protein assembly factor BamA/autotransporter translocation and assembly factor TamB